MVRIGRLAATLEEHARLALGDDIDGDGGAAALALDRDALIVSAQCAVDLIKELVSTTAESTAQWQAGTECGLLEAAAREARDGEE
jgi:hypothetical protein